MPSPADGRCLCCAAGRGVGRGSLAGAVCVWQVMWCSGRQPQGAAGSRFVCDFCHRGWQEMGTLVRKLPLARAWAAGLRSAAVSPAHSPPTHSLNPFLGTGRERGGGGGRGPGQQTHGRSAGAWPPAWLLHAHMPPHTATHALSTYPACLCPPAPWWPCWVLVVPRSRCALLCPARLQKGPTDAAQQPQECKQQ